MDGVSKTNSNLKQMYQNIKQKECSYYAISGQVIQNVCGITIIFILCVWLFHRYYKKCIKHN